MKSKIQKNKSEETFIRCFFIVLLIATAINFIGCSTFKKYSDLPAEERAAFLRQEAVNWLQDNKDNVKTGLVIAGKKAMQYAVSGDERKEISNQMYAAAVAFRSLATGKALTPEVIQKTLTQFSAGTTSVRYKEYISDATLLWGGIFKNLKLSENQQLAIDYLLILAEAAEEVAAIYVDEGPVITVL